MTYGRLHSLPFFICDKLVMSLLASPDRSRVYSASLSQSAHAYQLLSSQHQRQHLLNEYERVTQVVKREVGNASFPARSGKRLLNVRAAFRCQDS